MTPEEACHVLNTAARGGMHFGYSRLPAARVAAALVGWENLKGITFVYQPARINGRYVIRFRNVVGSESDIPTEFQSPR